MLTPAFELHQDDINLIVSVQVPYAKVSDVEVQFENTSFMFFCEPYYLRLNLPGNVVWVEVPSIQYDSEKRQFRILVPKKNKGEIFQNLDSGSCLFVANKSHFFPHLEIDKDLDDTEQDDMGWNEDLKAPNENFGSMSITGQQCGFANSYSFSVFNLKDEVSEIFDIKEPENKSLKVRKKERIVEENKIFDEEHYLADKYSDEEIQSLLSYQPEWEVMFEKHQTDLSHAINDKIIFSEKEKEAIKKLPLKDFSLDAKQTENAVIGLLDILFAFAYNKRTTEGDNTVESAWTINKISATLTWLEVFSSVESVFIACIRRSLIYPLYRHFELALTVMEDVRKIILLGNTYITKCLLEIHELFSASDPRYILNDLFITDYILWMTSNSYPHANFISLAKKMNSTLLTKGEVGLDLVDIEALAAMAWNNQDILRQPDNADMDTSSQVESRTASSDDPSLCSALDKMVLDSPDERAASGNASCSEYEICDSCDTSQSEDSRSSSEDEYSASSSSSSEDSSDSSVDEEFVRMICDAFDGERT